MKSTWYHMQCLPCAMREKVVLSLRIDRDAPPEVACPICGETLHFDGAEEADEAGYLPRGPASYDAAVEAIAREVARAADADDNDCPNNVVTADEHALRVLFEGRLAADVADAVADLREADAVAAAVADLREAAKLKEGAR